MISQAGFRQTSRHIGLSLKWNQRGKGFPIGADMGAGEGNAMQPRCHPRISVEYSASLQSDTGAGTGVLFDLSATGCRLQSDMTVEAGTYLALQVDLPRDRMPLAVDVSIVRWCRDGQFGVEFLRYGLGMRDRVMNLVQAQPVTAPAETLAPAEPAFAAASV
jgi:PilZ domain